MAKNHTLGLLYFLRKDKLNKNGEAPIYLRITVDGHRSNVSTNRTVHPDRWNDKADKVRGTNEESQTLNNYLTSFKSKVLDHHSNLLGKGKHITAETLRSAFLGLTDSRRSIIETFQYHINHLRQKIKIDYSVKTVVKYETTLKHLGEFIKHNYHVSDKFLDELNYKFITDFEHYLKTVKGCNHNTTLRYLRILRTVVNMAVANDWLTKDPFLKFKSHPEDVAFIYLNDEELQAIKDKGIKIPRLAIVRDIFVFSCYTGLAYADVAKLTPSDIVTGIDGEKWIFTYRTKTDVKSNIPLLPEAIVIINKYKDYPTSIHAGKLLPVISNQKLNAYLKELADICGIDKNITFHTARKTFATTVCLNNDVPIESVSRMIGHTNIRTTQRSYAKVLDKKVSADMKGLRERMYLKNKKVVEG